MDSSSSDTTPTSRAESNNQYVAEQEGYSKGLTARQINMIAIGSSIGTGLFLGAGGCLLYTSPSPRD